MSWGAMSWGAMSWGAMPIAVAEEEKREIGKPTPPVLRSLTVAERIDTDFAGSSSAARPWPETR
jgi:hypothetical protein